MAEMASMTITLVFIGILFRVSDYSPLVDEPPDVVPPDLGVTLSSVQDDSVAMLVTTRMRM